MTFWHFKTYWSRVESVLVIDKWFLILSFIQGVGQFPLNQCLSSKSISNVFRRKASRLSGAFIVQSEHSVASFSRFGVLTKKHKKSWFSLCVVKIMRWVIMMLKGSKETWLCWLDIVLSEERLVEVMGLFDSLSTYRNSFVAYQLFQLITQSVCSKYLHLL